MKRFIYCATALVAALFAASCQREMHEPVAEGGVTYTITLPETVQTRGASGYAEYDLYFEVYKTISETDLANADLKPLFERKETMTGNTTTVTLDLLNDQDYTVLFWANKKDVAYFDLDDLRKVTMKQAASNNNDRDAFCGMDQIAQHDGATSKTVTLTRPFAQLNIATLVSTTAGYDLTPRNSYVKVSDVPVTYNVATGDVSGDTAVGFTKNAVPADKKVNGTYDLVAMNYVLVPEGNVSVYYEIETVNGTVKNTVNNVPLKKNYRTNIIGNLLTSNATYTVEIKPGFEEGAYVGPEFVDEPAYNADTKTWTVTSAKELLWVAASVNGTLGLNTKSAETARNFCEEIIVLANDIDLQGAEWEPIGNKEHAFAGTFDGQEYTVSNFKVTEKAGWAGLFGRVQVGTVKNLNVKNVTIEANHYAGAIVGQGYVYMDNCHAENVDITVTIDREADGGKGDYGDKAGGLVGQNCEGGLKITNSSAKNVTITGYRDLGGIVGMAHNHNIVTGNTVEDITLVQNLEYGYQATIPTTLGGIVGRFGSNVKYEGNTKSGVVYDYPTVLSYDSTKSAVENGQILFDTVMAAEDGDIILLTAGDWRGTDGQTSRYTVNKDVTIIGLEDGVVLSSDKYGRVVDSEDADNAGVVTFKNLTMKTDHAWAAALYAKNYVTVNLIDVTLQTAGTTAILLDSSNQINGQHHTANTIVNVTNVTIDEGDYVELNANPCTSYQTDIVSYASFNYDETSNIGIVKPQGITRSTGDNLFVNSVALPAGTYVADGVTKEGLNYYVTNAAGLAYFSGKTAEDGAVINLESDIDFNNAEFEAIAAGYSKSFTFNGNNKTISNIKLVKCSHNSVGAASLFFCYTGGTININDLTVDNAQSEGATYAGTILGYTQGAATVKNVTVKNSSISGAKKVGGLAGFVEASTSKFLAENCKIINTTVVATEKQAGTIIGYNAKPAELNNCTVETSTATSPLYCDGGIRSTDPAQAKLTVDGKEFLPGGVTLTDEGVYVAETSDAYNWLKSNKPEIFENGKIQWGTAVYAYSNNGTEVTMTAAGEDAKIVRGLVGATVTDVTVAEGIEVIGDRTFRDAPNLATISLPNTLTELEEGAFQACGLTAITIPGENVILGKQSIGYLPNLETITITAKKVTIANYVARSCPKLKSVYIYSDEVVFESGSMYFTDCESNNTSGITYYVAVQTVADAVNASVPAGHAVGMQIKNIDGTVTYYTR